MIEAQEMLKAFTVSSYPMMKDNKRGELHRQIHKQAYPKTYDGPPVGPQDLARLLGAGRIR